MRITARRIALGAAGLALALNASPATLSAARADHCQSVLIFSGIQTAAASPSLNPGAGGCLNDDEATNTNVLFPGATFLSVGSLPTPVEAWVDVDGVVTPLTMTLAADGSRWNSQKVGLNNAKVATATVKTVTGLTITTTYTATPETEL